MATMAKTTVSDNNAHRMYVPRFVIWDGLPDQT
jgi:hypothetical protein